MKVDLTKAIISDVYLVDPHKLKFDEKIAGFNEIKDDASYRSLKSQIRDNTQSTPIYIRNGLVIDGRHRSKICMELSMQVKAVDIDPTLKDEDAVVLCNQNIFGGRNASPAQLAIKAHTLVEQFKYSDVKAVDLTGLRDPKAIGYVRRIKASVYDKQYNILATLLNGKSVNIPQDSSKPFISKSLDSIKRFIVLKEKQDLDESNSTTLEVPSIDYNTMMDSEVERDAFWDLTKHSCMSIEAKLKVIFFIKSHYSTKTFAEDLKETTSTCECVEEKVK